MYLCHREKRTDLLGENIDEQTQIATVMGVYKDLMRSFASFAYG